MISRFGRNVFIIYRVCDDVRVMCVCVLMDDDEYEDFFFKLMSSSSTRKNLHIYHRIFFLCPRDDRSIVFDLYSIIGRHTAQSYHQKK